MAVRHWAARSPTGTARQEWLRAMVEFQQLSAPTAAKSVEDTAFYRYGRLLSRNEVGSDPSQFAITAAAFHADQQGAPAPPAARPARDRHPRPQARRRHPRPARRAQRNPGRVGDRPATLVPAQPAAQARPRRPRPRPGGRDHALPDPRRRLAARPGGGRRGRAESVRGARRRLAGEGAARGQAALRLGRAEHGLRGRLPRLPRRLPRPGRPVAARSRLRRADRARRRHQQPDPNLLRLASPGVADLYQGTEFWDFSLVDPDNRRPVDFDARRGALDAGEDPAALLRIGATAGSSRR